MFPGLPFKVSRTYFFQHPFCPFLLHCLPFRLPLNLRIRVRKRTVYSIRVLAWRDQSRPGTSPVRANTFLFAMPYLESPCQVLVSLCACHIATSFPFNLSQLPRLLSCKWCQTPMPACPSWSKPFWKLQVAWL